MKTSNFELGNLIEGYKLCCQTEGKSPRTVEWYGSFLIRFLNFLKTKGFPTLLYQLGREHVRAFIKYLQTEARLSHIMLNKRLPITYTGYKENGTFTDCKRGRSTCKTG